MKIDFLPAYLKLKKMSPAPTCANCVFSIPYKPDKFFVTCIVNPYEYHEVTNPKLEVKSSKCSLYKPAKDGPAKDFTIQKAMQMFIDVTGVNPFDDKPPNRKDSDYRPYLVAYLSENGFSYLDIARVTDMTYQNINNMMMNFNTDTELPETAVYTSKKYRAAQ